MAKSTRALVLGTAGHIDHGKTSLVRALTGVDTDRLPEEKRRGITIELGFAAWELGPGLVASIVDVPGHEAFVRTMVAGAGGIDAVLLVVSAEEGVMPQTREHLHVCRLLGLRHGVVALTKVDRLGGDAEAVELAAADVRAALAELAPDLAGAPVVPCAATTGEGLPALTAAVRKVAAAVPPREARGRPVLPVDRVFAVKGHGTVATGTLLAGTLDLGRDARLGLVPAGAGRQPRELRARALHVRGAAGERATAGNRVALNLGNVATADLARGDVISSGPRVAAGQVLLATLTHLAHDERPWRSGTVVQVCAGTAHTTARLDPLGLLDAQSPAPLDSDLSPGTSDLSHRTPPDDPPRARTTSRRPARPAPPGPRPPPGAPSPARGPAEHLSSGTSPHLPANPSPPASHLSSGTSPHLPANPSAPASHLSSGTSPHLPANPSAPASYLSSGTSSHPPSADLSFGTSSHPPSGASPSAAAGPPAPSPARPPRPVVPAGATAVVRLRLDAPLPLWHGQRLILRTTRGGDATHRHGHTTGGGLVVDPRPPAGRGQRPRWLELARALHREGPSGRVRALLRHAGALGVTRDELEHRAGVVDLEPVLSAMRDAGECVALDEQRFVDAAVLPPLAAAAAAHVARFHAEHPLQPGLGRAAVAGGLPGRVAPDVAGAAVALALARGLVRADGELLTARPADAAAAGFPPKVQAVLDLYIAAGIAPPTLREVQDRVGLADRQALEALGALQRAGALVRVSPDLSLARVHHEALVDRARAHLRAHGRLDVQALKTLTGLSRKFVVPFLEHLDRLQVTRRQGDLRVPGPKL
jgi:small GTP-binding protein